MKRTLSVVTLLLMLSVSAFAQTTAIPPLMNFQGRLAKPDGTPVTDGSYQLTFSIFSAPTGVTALWTQTVSAIQVHNGVFSVLLGSGNPLTSDILNGTPYLEIKVGSDAPLTPRQQFASVAFSFKASTVPDGAITTSKLADGAITSGKLSSSFLSAGGDLTGTYPNPLLATLFTSLAKVSGGTLTATSTGRIGIGTTAPTSTLDVNGIATAHQVKIVGGSDVAEPYQIAPTRAARPLPGFVVTIDPHRIGQMRVAGKAYDRAVSGIISGANGIRPGLTLTQTGTVADGSLPVASMGRVWAWCDADANGPIAPGDLLTTSNTPGHAMRVANLVRANGAIIGKAMSPLKHGKGLVLVLVTLK